MGEAEQIATLVEGFALIVVVGVVATRHNLFRDG